MSITTKSNEICAVVMAVQVGDSDRDEKGSSMEVSHWCKSPGKKTSSETIE